MENLIGKVKDGQILSREEARYSIEHILTDASDKDIGDFLIAMNDRMEYLQVTSKELVGFAEGIRSQSKQVTTKKRGVTDTCGTGGDNSGTINVSTAAAIIAASGNIPVAKHGNYAISSKSGSANVLEELGYKIPKTPEEASQQLDDTGFTFLLAPYFNPAMSRVARIRKEIGRTIFNVLGPLCNPVRLATQIIGVYDGALCEPMCEALKYLGRRRALVAHGDGGLDELSVIGHTTLYELRDGKITERTIFPPDFGYRVREPESLAGHTAPVNALYFLNVINGEIGSAKSELIMLNAGAAIYVARGLKSLEDGVTKAEELVKSGRAARKWSELFAQSQIPATIRREEDALLIS